MIKSFEAHSVQLTCQMNAPKTIAASAFLSFPRTSSPIIGMRAKVNIACSPRRPICRCAHTRTTKQNKKLGDVLSLTAAVFVGAIVTILIAVAEKTAFDALAITASQQTVLAQRLIGVQQWFCLALFVLQLAVFHRVFPVARLLLNVKEQSSRAANCLQALHQLFDDNNQIKMTQIRNNAGVLVSHRCRCGYLVWFAARRTPPVDMASL